MAANNGIHQGWEEYSSLPANLFVSAEVGTSGCCGFSQIRVTHAVQDAEIMKLRKVLTTIAVSIAFLALLAITGCGGRPSAISAANPFPEQSRSRRPGPGVRSNDIVAKLSAGPLTIRIIRAFEDQRADWEAFQLSQDSVGSYALALAPGNVGPAPSIVTVEIEVSREDGRRADVEHSPEMGKAGYLLVAVPTALATIQVALSSLPPEGKAGNGVEDALALRRSPPLPSGRLLQIILRDEPGLQPVLAKVTVGSGETAEFYSFPLERLTAGVPTGEGNAVRELDFEEAGEGSVRVSFYERNVGDYDNNGIVNIADITPLAQLFNLGREDGVPEVVLGKVDGNEDSVINIADITPLAAHFNTNVAGYRLEKSLSPDGPWEDAGGGQMQERVQPIFDEEKYNSIFLVPRAHYEFTDTVDLSSLSYYRAVAYGMEGGEATRGVEGEAVLIPDFVPPEWTDTVGVASVEATADNELTVSWGAATDARSEPVTYNLYYSMQTPVNPGSSAVVRGISGLSRTLTNLSGGQEYFFIVRAEDAVGNEDTNTVELSGIPSGEPIVDNDPPYWVDPEKVGVYDVSIDMESETMTVYFGEADDLLSPPVKYRLIVEWQYEYRPSDTFKSIYDDYVSASPYEVTDIYSGMDEWEQGVGIYFVRVLAYDQVGNENDEDERYWASPSGWQIERVFHSDELVELWEEDMAFGFTTHANLDDNGEPIFLVFEGLRRDQEQIIDRSFGIERDPWGNWTPFELTGCYPPDDWEWADSGIVYTRTGPARILSYSNPEVTRLIYREAPGVWKYKDVSGTMRMTELVETPNGYIFSAFRSEGGSGLTLISYGLDVEGEEIWTEEVGELPPGDFGYEYWMIETPDGRPVIHGNNVTSNAFYFERDSLERESGWTGQVWSYPEYPWFPGSSFENDEVFFRPNGNPVAVVALQEEYQGFTGTCFMERIDGEWTITGHKHEWKPGAMDDAGYTLSLGYKDLNVYAPDGDLLNSANEFWLWGIDSAPLGGTVLVNRAIKRLQIPWVVDDEEIPQEWWGVYILTSPADFPYPVINP